MCADRRAARVRRPLSAAGSRGSVGVRTLAVYVAAIAGAELCTVFVDVVAGVLAHALLLLALLNHHALARAGADGEHDAGRSQSDVLLVVSLVPLLRILSVAMPVPDLSDVYDYALVGAPLLVGAGLAARIVGAPRLLRSLRKGSAVQAAVALAGIPLGAVAYLVARPEPLVEATRWSEVALAGAILFVFTAVPEEILFRGLIQSAVTAVVGRGGFVWSSALNGIAYVGVRPPGYAAFVVLVALAFGWVVYRTGALLGVVLAHALLNIGLLLVWPSVLG